MDSFGAGAALQRRTHPGHIPIAYLTRKGMARIRMNVATHQERKKNEKMDKIEEEEERKQLTDFKEAASCPFAVVQGAARRENRLCEGSVFSRGGWDPLEGQQPFRLNPNGVGDRTATLRQLLIGADNHSS